MSKQVSLQATPFAIVDLQLRAYNAHDLDAYCALFAADAVISKLDEDRPLARGADAIRAYYAARFRNPQLHCRIRLRTALGNFVIDHEEVAGIVADPLEVIAIYEVRESLIHSVRFIWPGEPAPPLTTRVDDV